MAKDRTRKSKKKAEANREPIRARGWIAAAALEKGPPIHIYASPIMQGGKPIDIQVEVVEIIE